MIVLGIETSCDDTGIALYDGTNSLVLANLVNNQSAQHAQYGGIVPEIAARDHAAKIGPLLYEALKQSNTNLLDIQGIAYTARPGLVGALIVGAAFGQGLAYALKLPIIDIHHLEGHLLSVFLNTNEVPYFPYIALIVSGGHTQLTIVHSYGQYELLGQSLDDAAGEAFDKTAKILGLGYPGGPAIEQEALLGHPFFNLPSPLMHKKTFNFSFSGLKSAVFRAWDSVTHKNKEMRCNMAYDVQEIIINILVKRSIQAVQKTGIKRLCIVGGVSANKRLRTLFQQAASMHDIQVFFPPLEYCMDNGAMIALAGYHRLLNNERCQTFDFLINAKQSLYSSKE